VADASGTRTKAKSGRRIWRRVGGGALIVLAVLVVAAAIALWLGPPRDPKSFALDDEDFGLGFRVGDPWDPDAFEAAMKANGLDVQRSSFRTDEDCSFHMASFYTGDYYISVGTASDSKANNAILRSINITPFTQNRDPDKATYRASRAYSFLKELRKEARQRFPDDKNAGNDWFLARVAEKAAEHLPNPRSSDGIGLASTQEGVKRVYGEPFDSVALPGMHWLVYIGNKNRVTFFLRDGIVDFFYAAKGYQRCDIEARLRYWKQYFVSHEVSLARLQEIRENQRGGSALTQ